MSQKTLSQLRDADFALSLKESLKRCRQEFGRPTGTQIISDALASRPQRFYLSHRTVESRLRLIRKDGNYCSSRRTPSRDQWAEISKAVDRYLARHKEADFSEAVDYVVNYARPSRFFISDRKARELFRRTLSREYCFVMS